MFSSYFMETLGRTSLVSPDDTWTLMSVMLVAVAASIWLEQKYNWASKLSGAIIALIFAMVLTNFNILPTSCVLYDDIVWGVVVPMSVALLLLQCNLKRVWKDTGRMLAVFLIGAVGTTVGALVAYYALEGSFGDTQGLATIAAVTTGAYVGGGVNSAALYAQYPIEGSLRAARTVADNFLMALYFFALIAFAGMKFFRKHFTHPHIEAVESNLDPDSSRTQAAAFWGRKDISLKDIAINLAYASVVVWISRLISSFVTGMIPENPGVFLDFIGKFVGSQYVWITAISAIVATFCDKQVNEHMHGYQEIGTFLIYTFLFVIGVPADLISVIKTSPLLFVFMAIIVVFNLVFSFVGAKLVKADLEDAIIASNANIGGPTTAAGMAISQGWNRLVGPAMLVGVLGYVIGTYLGILVGTILGI